MDRYDARLKRVVDYYYPELRVMELLKDNPPLKLTKSEHVSDIDSMPTFLTVLPDDTILRVSFRDYNTMIEDGSPQDIPQHGDTITPTIYSYCWTSSGLALIIGVWEKTEGEQ